MTSFAQSCKELMNKIRIANNKRLDYYHGEENKGLADITIYNLCQGINTRINLYEMLKRERLARAKDEVEYLIHLSRVIDDMNGNSWQELKERISDLEEGIKILEGIQ